MKALALVAVAVAGLLTIWVAGSSSVSAEPLGLTLCPSTITTQDVCYLPLPDDYNGPDARQSNSDNPPNPEYAEVMAVTVADGNGYVDILLIQPCDGGQCPEWKTANLATYTQQTVVDNQSTTTNEDGTSTTHPQNYVAYGQEPEAVEQPQPTEPETTEPEPTEPEATEPEAEEVAPTDEFGNGPASDCDTLGVGAHQVVVVAGTTGINWLLCWGGVGDLGGDDDPFNTYTDAGPFDPDTDWHYLQDCFEANAYSVDTCLTWGRDSDGNPIPLD